MSSVIQLSFFTQSSSQNQNKIKDKNVSIWALREFGQQYDSLRRYDNPNISEGIDVKLALQSIQEQTFILRLQNDIKKQKASLEEDLVISKKFKASINEKDFEGTDIVKAYALIDCEIFNIEKYIESLNLGLAPYRNKEEFIKAVETMNNSLKDLTEKCQDFEREKVNSDIYKKLEKLSEKFEI